MNNSDRVVDLAKSIELVHGKEEVAHELLEMFIKDLPKYRDGIRNSFNNKDKEELFTQVHNLNGSACYVSVPSLKDAAYKLETAIKKKDRKQIPKLIEEVELQINKVLYVYENKIHLRSDPAC